MAKKKGKDKDGSGSRDSEAVLGALGLALPDMDNNKSKRAPSAPAAAPENDLSLSFDISAPAPAPAKGRKPIAAPAPVPIESTGPSKSNFSQDTLMLSFDTEAPAPVRGKPAKPSGNKRVGPSPPTQVPSPPKPQARPKPAAAPRKLASLPELPQFVKPEDIVDIQGFDAPPTEGKGKIKEVIWNLKATDQASNVISREKRSLSPLMAEALDQVQLLRDTIKQQKKGAPRVPAQASAPARTPSQKPPPKPAPKPAAKLAPKPAGRPAPKPAPRPAVKQAPLPEPIPEPAPEPVEESALPELGPEPEPVEQPVAKPPSQSRPGRSRPQPLQESVAEPERDIITTPVKSRLSDNVMTAQVPIEKKHWDEAKSVMAPMATTKFTAVSQQNFDAAPSPVAQQASSRPGAARTSRAPVPVPMAEETSPQEMQEAPAPAKTTGKDQMLPGGGKICGKCGGNNFREDNDKSKPLSFTPPFLYAKKYTCKSCGHVFNLEGQGEAEAPVTQAAQRPTRPSQVAAGRQAAAPTPAARQAPARHVQTTWEDTTPESVRPSDVLAKKGIRQEPLPSKVSAQEYEPVEEQAPAPEQKEGGRLVCPNCGGTSFNLIQDKTRPISYGMGGMGAVYAKVHQCKKCGTKVD
ncbi:MAG TPA: hypothetical protein VKM55_14620 [Candidatus Lokiarchaeia archaeon]|nr:hypothetical protein [Candidatus Lokiarchaeia archaeon]